MHYVHKHKLSASRMFLTQDCLYVVISSIISKFAIIRKSQAILESMLYLCTIILLKKVRFHMYALRIIGSLCTMAAACLGCSKRLCGYTRQATHA